MRTGAIVTTGFVLALVFAPTAAAEETHPPEHGNHFPTPVVTPTPTPTQSTPTNTSTPTKTSTPVPTSSDGHEGHDDGMDMTDMDDIDSHDDGVHEDGHGGPRIATPDRESRLAVIGGFALLNSAVVAGAAVMRRKGKRGRRAQRQAGEQS